MIALDDRPVPPQLPQFTQAMEQFLIAAARADVTTQIGRSARYRPVRLAAAGLAAAATVAGAAVAISDATSGRPHNPTANPTSNPSQQGGVHIHLVGFTVDTNPGGTVTLTLTQGQLFNPDTMRQALAKAGVPAVVTLGSVCTVPGHPSDGLPAVISHSPATHGHSITTITPSAIPAGQKLSFGYFPVTNGGGLFISLVPNNSTLTCSSTPPAPPHHGSGPTR